MNKASNNDFNTKYTNFNYILACLETYLKMVYNNIEKIRMEIIIRLIQLALKILLN